MSREQDRELELMCEQLLKGSMAKTATSGFGVKLNLGRELNNHVKTAQGETRPVITHNTERIER